MRHFLCAALVLLLGASPAFASTIENVGTDIAIALPALAGGVSLVKDDWTGLAELGVTGVATVGTAYGLKHIVKEKRPDGSDYQSFPSDTTALAFAPAAYLWDRYGWEYGLPAYAAASFVAYSRVDARKHHWYDVTASAVMAIGFSKLITTRYQGRLVINAGMDGDGGYAGLTYRF